MSNQRLNLVRQPLDSGRGRPSHPGERSDSADECQPIQPEELDMTMSPARCSSALRWKMGPFTEAEER
jgi:hypothetical protein